MVFHKTKLNILFWNFFSTMSKHPFAAHLWRENSGGLLGSILYSLASNAAVSLSKLFAFWEDEKQILHCTNGKQEGWKDQLQIYQMLEPTTRKQIFKIKQSETKPITIS